MSYQKKEYTGENQACPFNVFQPDFKIWQYLFLN